MCSRIALPTVSSVHLELCVDRRRVLSASRSRARSRLGSDRVNQGAYRAGSHGCGGEQHARLVGWCAVAIKRVGVNVFSKHPYGSIRRQVNIMRSSHAVRFPVPLQPRLPWCTAKAADARRQTRPPSSERNSVPATSMTEPSWGNSSGSINETTPRLRVSLIAAHSSNLIRLRFALFVARSISTARKVPRSGVGHSLRGRR